ncbi:unnamed protein product [Orchesella dallaii]|uniref:Protein quiver n=1 Tax=Orchesella dallaii TaxID=48710 RepID=A0ABP1RYZ6_9HEXA
MKILLSCAVLVCVAVWIVPVFSANVTQCFQCEHFDYYGNNATNIETCTENPPPATLLLNCSLATDEPRTDWKCVKVSGTIEVDDENFKYIRRYCTLDKALNVTCKETKSLETRYGFIKKGNQCVCDEKDGCNAGSTVTIAAATLAAGLLMTSFSKILRD